MGTMGAARAGDLATTVKDGDLSKAGALLDRPDADAEDAAARCHMLLMQSRLDLAKACLRERLAADPEDKAALNNLAIAQFRSGAFAAAAESFAKRPAAPLAPQKPRRWPPVLPTA